MNSNGFFSTSSPEAELITQALDELCISTGIKGRLYSRGSHALAEVSLQVAEQPLHYMCEVKRKIDRFSTLQDLKIRSGRNQSGLLICEPLTHELSSRCRELDIQFIDTAGNAYLTDRKGILIYVTGRKPDKEVLSTRSEATITPAALRIIFAILANPIMLNKTYREISASVQISIGMIGKVFETLKARGYIGLSPSGACLINSPESLLSEWAIGYTGRIRPKLKKLRFSAPNPDDLRMGWKPGSTTSAWSGEVAADMLTKHLKAVTYTIYMDMENRSELTELVKRFRLKADTQGDIEIIQPFWDMNYFNEFYPTVPPHLVYADLIGTQDPRNLTAAKQISDIVINHVHNTVQ